MYFFVSICRYVSRLITSSLCYITCRANLFLYAWHFACKITLRVQCDSDALTRTRALRRACCRYHSQHVLRAARTGVAVRSRSTRRAHTYVYLRVKQSKKRYIFTVRTYLCCISKRRYVAPVVRARLIRANCGWAAGGRGRARHMYLEGSQ